MCFLTAGFLNFVDGLSDLIFIMLHYLMDIFSKETISIHEQVFFASWLHNLFLSITL